MTTTLESWTNESSENKRAYEQEGLILDVTEEIWAAMERRNINKQQLAEKLGTGKSYVSQLLTGARNMTLRTLSDIASALDQRVTISFVNAEAENNWKILGATNVKNIAAPVFPAEITVASNDSSWMTVEFRR